MPITIQNKYNFGDKVYLKSDIEQLPYIVVEIIIMPGNVLGYQILSGNSACIHYEIELSGTQDKSMTIMYAGSI